MTKSWKVSVGHGAEAQLIVQNGLVCRAMLEVLCHTKEKRGKQIPWYLHLFYWRKFPEPIFPRGVSDK